MDAQELRNLQEAYSKVVGNQQINEEVSDKTKKKFQIMKMKKKLQNPYSSDWNKKISFALQNKIVADKKREDKLKEDIYDIILSHLLDEGYAETPEAAEAIMVNMSEEWRDTIIEEAPERITIGPASPRLMKDAGPARVHNPKKPKKVKRYN